MSRMERQYPTTCTMSRGKEVAIRYHTFCVHGYWVKHGSRHKRQFKTGDCLPNFVNPRELHIELWGGVVDLTSRQELLALIRESANLRKFYLWCILTPEESSELHEFANLRIDHETTSNRDETTHHFVGFREAADYDDWWQR